MTPTPQPKALELAEIVRYTRGSLPPETRNACSAELRRQHAEIERLNRIVTVSAAAHKILQDSTDSLRAEVERLKRENANLRSVMIAAAEEIHEHWDAHCDSDGYGPANLMRRLEAGIPSEYAYKAGDFARMRAEVERLLADAERLDWLDEQNARKNRANGTTYGWSFNENCNRIALEDHAWPPVNVRAAIDAAREAKG